MLYRTRSERRRAIAREQKSCNMFVYMYNRTYTMKRHEETPADVRRWFIAALEKLWPVATGSLSLRKGRCIRKNCSACASGQGHSSYALYGRLRERRFSIYVPDRMVKDVRAAIRNGRLLQEMLNEAGVRYVKAVKRQQKLID